MEMDDDAVAANISMDETEAEAVDPVIALVAVVPNRVQSPPPSPDELVVLPITMSLSLVRLDSRLDRDKE